MLKSQLEIIEQGCWYLNIVSTEDYIEVVSPNFISSAGAHIRHIIDHYQAIISGLDNKLINYDSRNRGGQFESSPKLAMKKLTEIADWISQLSTTDLETHIILSTEVSVTNKNVQQVTTSVARELVFAGSHAVHHYAMIAQITFAQHAVLPNTFGLAPATATFIRQNSLPSTATLANV